MSTSPLALYVSSGSWAAPAPAGALSPPGGRHADAATADWDAVANVLRDRHGPVDVTLVLSAQLCRFLTLPWLSTCWTAGAIRRQVEAAFAELAAVTPASHRICIDWPAYGQDFVAAAYPRALVARVDAALLKRSLAVTGVESSLGPVLRRHGAALGAGAQLLAYAEDDGITGLGLEDGRVVQVDTLGGDGTGLDDIGAWSARKRVAYADDAQLRWLGSTPAPARFAGGTLAVAGTAASAGQGQALVAAWR